MLRAGATCRTTLCACMQWASACDKRERVCARTCAGMCDCGGDGVRWGWEVGAVVVVAMSANSGDVEAAVVAAAVVAAAVAAAEVEMLPSLLLVIPAVVW